MLCNIYIKESTPELKAMGIRSSSPIFFVDVSQQSIMKLKNMEVKNMLEIYLVQDDPYLKDLSNKWVNGGVQLPEVKIVEKHIQLPPKIIEKIIEVPVEVIKEVEVVKEVVKEVIREVHVESKTIETTQPEDGYLIDTKVAFNDYVKKTKSQKTQKTQQEDDSILQLPDVIVDPLQENEEVMPILLEVDKLVEDPIEYVDLNDNKTKPDKPKSESKKPRKKKEAPKEIPMEVIVELTDEEIKQYEKEIKEE